MAGLMAQQSHQNLEMLHELVREGVVTFDPTERIQIFK